VPPDWIVEAIDISGNGIMWTCFGRKKGARKCGFASTIRASNDDDFFLSKSAAMLRIPTTQSPPETFERLYKYHRG
jgi:hypothetical protein